MKMGKMVTGGVLAAALVLSMTACGENTEIQEAQDVLVDMESVQMGSLTVTNSFVGTISAQESVYVIPLAQGTVTEVYYGVGDTVNAGDILFKIDDEYAQLSLEQAKLAAQSASQQANMQMGSAAEATDLQLQSAYEQAQIGYYIAGKSYDMIDDAVDDLEEQKDTIAATIASMAQLGTDTTLSTSSVRRISSVFSRFFKCCFSLRPALSFNLSYSPFSSAALSKSLSNPIKITPNQNTHQQFHSRTASKPIYNLHQRLGNP